MILKTHYTYEDGTPFCYQVFSPSGYIGCVAKMNGNKGWTVSPAPGPGNSRYDTTLEFATPELAAEYLQ